MHVKIYYQIKYYIMIIILVGRINIQHKVLKYYEIIYKHIYIYL